MSSYFRLALTTQTGSTSVVPVSGGAFGEVCPDAVQLFSTGMRPRHIDGFAAQKVWGPQPWSPPSP